MGKSIQRGVYKYMQPLKDLISSKSKLSAANLKRIQHWVDSTDFGCISACRGSKTKGENRANTKELENLIAKQDSLGYIKVFGSYLENTGINREDISDMRREKLEKHRDKPAWVERKMKNKLSEENSFFVFVKPDYNFNLLPFLLTLGKKFEQESILYGTGDKVSLFASTTHITYTDNDNKGIMFKVGQRMATFRERLWGIDTQKDKPY